MVFPYGVRGEREREGGRGGESFMAGRTGPERRGPRCQVRRRRKPIFYS